MIAPFPARLLLISALLVAALLCSGCVGESMSVRADNCWGHGPTECGEVQRPMLRALGYDGAGLAALAVNLTCGAVVDCAALAILARPQVARKARPAAAPPAAKTVTAATSVADSSGGQAARPAKDSTAGSPIVMVTPREAAEPHKEAKGEASVAADGAPGDAQPSSAGGGEAQSEAKLAVVVGPSGTCKGIDIAALEHKGALSGPDKACLMDAARGKVGATDPNIQIAVITLYNQKVPGWQKAVEAALSRKNLTNAPNLNLAGIKPAYDGKRYSTVIKRSDVVWRNLNKGYALSAEQRTFLAEFACRSALQLSLMQKPNSRGFDWCERWRSRLSKSGAPTSEVDDIIDQLED